MKKKSFLAALAIISIVNSLSGQAEANVTDETMTVAQCKADALKKVQTDTDTDESFYLLEPNLENGTFYFEVLPSISGTSRVLALKTREEMLNLDEAAIVNLCEVYTTDL